MPETLERELVAHLLAELDRGIEVRKWPFLVAAAMLTRDSP
jgi:hypothetical protein